MRKLPEFRQLILLWLFVSFASAVYSVNVSASGSLHENEHDALRVSDNVGY